MNSKGSLIKLEVVLPGSSPIIEDGKFQFETDDYWVRTGMIDIVMPKKDDGTSFIVLQSRVKGIFELWVREPVQDLVNRINSIEMGYDIPSGPEELVN